GLDPVAAKDAIEKLKGVDLSKMTPNEQVEALKAQLTGQANKTVAERDAEIAKLKAEIEGGEISRAFASSPFLRERFILDLDVAQAMFGKHVKYENGQITVVGADGQPIADPGKFGTNASFDQALEVLVSARADKEKLLKAAPTGGMGSGPNAGRNAAGVVQVTREELRGKTPTQIKDTMDAVKKGEAVLVD
ncbi:MAG: DUF6651 domain-containing protein, partial [Casimicrobium sp.]